MSRLLLIRLKPRLLHLGYFHSESRFQTRKLSSNNDDEYYCPCVNEYMSIVDSRILENCIHFHGIYDVELTGKGFKYKFNLEQIRWDIVGCVRSAVINGQIDVIYNNFITHRWLNSSIFNLICNTDFILRLKLYLNSRKKHN